MKSKILDKYWIGFALGILLPFILMCIVFLMKFNGRMRFTTFISKMVEVSAFPALISLCAIVNLGTFFIFYQKWHNNAARGVIMATMLFVIIVLGIKFKDI